MLSLSIDKAPHLSVSNIVKDFARQIMQEALVDDEEWYDSEVELIGVVNYLMKFDKTLLRRAMNNRNYFKKFVGFVTPAI